MIVIVPTKNPIRFRNQDDSLDGGQASHVVARERFRVANQVHFGDEDLGALNVMHSELDIRNGFEIMEKLRVWRRLLVYVRLKYEYHDLRRVESEGAIDHPAALGAKDRVLRLRNAK